jgi:SAM-dependent methyltransferase
MKLGWLRTRGTQRSARAGALLEPGVEVKSAWIGNRRYFFDLPYTLPKDELEARRLDFQHHYMRAVLKGHYMAPLAKKEVRQIVDIGCGTGRWCMDIAQAFPHARVHGLDIDIPQSGSVQAPLNYTFLQGNVLERLPFANAFSDFTHQRLLVAAIPTAKWPGVINELARITRPGGWVELVEACDAYEHAGPALQQFLAWGRSMSSARGIEVGQVANLDMLLSGVGLRSVEKLVLRMPVGSWGGRLGHALAQNMLAAFIGLRGLFCQMLPITPELFDATHATLAAEWEAYHTIFHIYVAYGQK